MAYLDQIRRQVELTSSRPVLAVPCALSGGLWSEELLRNFLSELLETDFTLHHMLRIVVILDERTVSFLDADCLNLVNAQGSNGYWCTSWYVSSVWKGLLGHKAPVRVVVVQGFDFTHRIQNSDPSAIGFWSWLEMSGCELVRDLLPEDPQVVDAFMESDES